MISRLQNEARGSYELPRAPITNAYSGGMMSKLKNSKYELVVQEMPTHALFMNLTGEIFGRLTVTSYAGTRGKAKYWNCICECGGASIVAGGHLRDGTISSCGCLQSELASERRKTHGQARPGKRSKNWRTWRGMKSRAITGTVSPENYLDRGISIYPPWVGDFVAFDTWVKENLGVCPEGCSLDRIDNDGNYEPGNLRWATARTQALNRRNTWMTSLCGQPMTVAEACDTFSLPYGTVKARVKTHGWALADALATPVGKKRPPPTINPGV